METGRGQMRKISSTNLADTQESAYEGAVKITRAVYITWNYWTRFPLVFLDT